MNEVTKELVPVGRPSFLRQTNASTILKLLRETGPCSKADLVRASGLSAPTVTNVVAHLSSVNLIEPIGEGESSGGRPPDMIRFKADRGCVAAVDIKIGHLRFLLTDLNGYPLETAEVALPQHSATPEVVCAQIKETLRSLVRKRKQKLEQLLALIIGVPAITNVKDGTVLSVSPLKGWRNVPLRTMLNKEFDCLVLVENDTNLAAQGERYRGAALAEENFVFITIGESVGAGIFIDGKIYHGSEWSAGEIGYLRVPRISTRRSTIHEFGQLEKVLGSSGILKSWRTKGQSMAPHIAVHHAEQVLDLAVEGNAHARKILLQKASILTDAILNLALILNPGLVLLGGEIGSHPALLDAVKTLLKGNEFAIARVALGSLGNSAVLWGAISIALESTATLLIQQPDTASLK
ncbi:MAG TPA: ROK family transcriptional regulator [Acidobacteriaceae bacterium]|nr:ROK family transcriptional regulator [Acidobacteriaceae bacterium]